MDYNNGNDGEKLFEQRNESSVLFSLDSLAAQNSGSGDDSDSPFGGSGDKSGLIDLNTLAEMGSSNRDQDDYNPNAAVFNSVRSKKQSTGLIIGIGIGVLVLILAAVAVWYVHTKNVEEAQAAAEEQAKAEQKQADEMAALKAQLDQANQDKLEAQALANKRAADAQKAAEEAERRMREEEERKKNEQVAVGKTPSSGSGSSSSGSGSSGSGNTKTPPKGKGPSTEAVKNALIASQTKAAKCGKNGNLVVSMTLTGAGKAKNVTAVSGSFKGTPTEKCILTVVEKHNFPDFTGPDVSGVKYNYKL